MTPINRRAFLKAAAAAPALAATPWHAAAAAQAPAAAVPAAGGGGLRKAVYAGMLPKELTYRDKFQLARDVGFDGVEIGTITDQAVAAEIKTAAEATGVTIHGVMNADHWRFPLSSSDPAIVTQSVQGMETSLRNAKLWGADCVLLVPAVVNPQTGYKDAWTRSQAVIRQRILPLAQDLKIVIGIENVWNKFLLSPLELGQYVSEFKSPWVKAYVDVGNMLFYGYPQDWIRTLGPAIARVHIKDFALDRRASTYAWKNIGEGDVDWVEVRKALADVNYQGWITTEIAAGDAAYLKDVVARFDRFLAAQKPVA